MGAATGLGTRGRCWVLASLLITALVLVPVLALAWRAARGSGGLWSHLARHVLPHALAQTVTLMVGVGILTAVIGTRVALLVTAHDFPGRRWMEWALLLPLAMPTYIVAHPSFWVSGR